MIITKYTAVNVILFFICLIFCLMLFSLENKHQTYNNQFVYKQPSLHNPKLLKLFNLNFEYLINNHVCENHANITAVIIVTSYYGNIETRSAMRRSFSNEQLKKMNLRRVFLLAVGPQDNKLDINYKAILNENDRFEDLIQGNFKEAYRNLTYKHLMGLEWASTFCKHAKYIIKMDDDIVINMHKLLNMIYSLQPTNNNDLLAGYILRGMVPIREPANKWYVTANEYPTSVYPPFVSGWFYITTPKLAAKLVKLSQHAPYFWIDDVFVTGILANKLNVKHYELNRMFAVHAEYLQCCIQGVKQHLYECDFIVGPNGGDNNLFYTFNKVMSKCLSRKCVQRPPSKSINDTCVAERKYFFGRGKALIENVKLF